MLTKMTEADWAVALEVFRASLPRRGDKGRDDRLFLEALHYFSVNNITWRGLPERYGYWNSVWKRFSRLSKQSENSSASSALRYDARRPNKISPPSSQSPQASS
ncbi:transposase (plasmid) [Agrobacterium vitis]|uniref:transposase n=2 Tax=Rhizobium/Agrobacterium group TaxID=227290 RepID=UPI003D2D7BCA